MRTALALLASMFLPACGGLVRVDESALVPDATSDDATSGVVLDARADARAEEDAGARDAFGGDAATAEIGPADAPPLACACCGAPFAARLPEWTTGVLTTPAGELFAAGNLITGSSLGPLWLMRVGDRGVPAWKQVYEGETGMLTALVQTKGGFALVRSGGSGNIGVHVVAVDDEGVRRWTKKLDDDKKNVAANGAAAVGSTIVVAGGLSDPTSNRAWTVRLDLDGNVLSEAIEPATSIWTTIKSNRSGILARCNGRDLCVVEAADGTTVWRHSLPLDWAPMQIALAEDGSLYAAGAQGGRLLVARFDPKGALLWEKLHGATRPTEASVQALVALDGGWAMHGYVVDKPLPPTPAPIDWYWYVVQGDAAGNFTWAKGYAPAGPRGGQGRALAACKDGLLLVGSTYTPDAASWLLRTNEKGGVPLAPPGSFVDY